MTKLLSTAIAFALAGATPAFADDAHHPAAQSAASQLATPAPGSASQPSGASSAGKRGMTENSTGATGQMPSAVSGGMRGPRGAGGAIPGSNMMGPDMMGGGMMGSGTMGPGMMGGDCHGMMGPGMMGGGTMGPGMMGGGMMGPGMMGRSMGGGADPCPTRSLRRISTARQCHHDEVRKKLGLCGQILDELASARSVQRGHARPTPSARNITHLRSAPADVEAGIAAQTGSKRCCPRQRQKARISCVGLRKWAVNQSDTNPARSVHRAYHSPVSMKKPLCGASQLRAVCSARLRRIFGRPEGWLRVRPDTFQGFRTQDTDQWRTTPTIDSLDTGAGEGAPTPLDIKSLLTVASKGLDLPGIVLPYFYRNCRHHIARVYGRFRPKTYLSRSIDIFDSDVGCNSRQRASCRSGKRPIWAGIRSQCVAKIGMRPLCLPRPAPTHSSDRSAKPANTRSHAAATIRNSVAFTTGLT